LTSTANIKKKTNNGYLDLTLSSLYKKFNNIINGISHKVLATFKVAATSTDSVLYSNAVPITDDVSWTAKATNEPNSVLFIDKKDPIYGKNINATKLNIKIIVNAKIRSLGFALMIGAIAAIAVPPHIAAPEEIRIEIFLSNFNILEITKPPKKDKKTNKVIQPK
jgi:hypothetical protein